MSANSVQEIVDGLTSEEREKFKDLIKESEEREKSIAQYRASMNNSVGKLKGNVVSLTESLKKLAELSIILQVSLGKLQAANKNLEEAKYTYELLNIADKTKN